MNAKLFKRSSFFDTDIIQERDTDRECLCVFLSLFSSDFQRALFSSDVSLKKTQTHTQTHTHTHRHRHTHAHTDTHTDRHTDTTALFSSALQGDRVRETETGRWIEK